MSTHTPGPWVAEYMGEVNGVRMSWLVKDKLSIGTRNPADEALTSAAPDMLRLAYANLGTLEIQREHHIRWGKGHSEIDAAIDDTKAVIAKATGAA